MIIMEMKIYSVLAHPQFHLHLYLQFQPQRLHHHLPNQVNTYLFAVTKGVLS